MLELLVKYQFDFNTLGAFDEAKHMFDWLVLLNDVRRQDDKTASRIFRLGLCKPLEDEIQKRLLFFCAYDFNSLLLLGFFKLSL